MAVHGELGQGFLEPVYQSALAVELSSRNVPFRREAEIPIRYKATVLDVFYRPDYICFDEVVFELKALPSIGGVEESHMINYLKATGLKIGLLLNFGSGSVQYKRFVS